MPATPAGAPASNTPNPTPATPDRIEKQITLDAPRSRVWRALTDVTQFNAWFGVSLTAPFTAGTAVSGHISSPKYAHVEMTIWIETIEPERYFAFRWHPYAIEEGVDHASEPTTLVSFTLDEVGDGTRLTVVEAGFDAIPESRRARAFTNDSNGWTSQLENIRKYLAAAQA